MAFFSMYAHCLYLAPQWIRNIGGNFRTSKFRMAGLKLHEVSYCIISYTPYSDNSAFPGWSTRAWAWQSCAADQTSWSWPGHSPPRTRCRRSSQSSPQCSSQLRSSYKEYSTDDKNQKNQGSRKLRNKIYKNRLQKLWDSSKTDLKNLHRRHEGSPSVNFSIFLYV
jgi:hypothetical protein